MRLKAKAIKGGGIPGGISVVSLLRNCQRSQYSDHGLCWHRCAN
jgi:hypothetical protein